MLKIRLSRTGKNRQPSFRVVVQEHTAPIKGRFVESIGLYQPTTPDKAFTIDSERVKHWISVGARPSDMVATLLKKQGFEGMEQYMEPRDKKRKSRSEDAEGGRAEAPQQEKSKAKAEKAAPSASVASRAAAERSEAEAPQQEKAETKTESAAPASENAKSEEAAVAEPAPAPKDAPPKNPPKPNLKLTLIL